MFGIEEDFKQLMEQVYGPLGKKEQEESARIAKELVDNAVKEVRMTDKIILELTLEELKTLDKHIEYNEETKSVFDKIKYAYPQPKMTLENEGDYAVVSYNDTTYYRLMGEDSCFCWYKRGGVSANHPVPTLVFVTDAETDRLLEGLYYNYIVVKKEKEQRQKELVRESVKWCEEHPDKSVEDYLTPKFI